MQDGSWFMGEWGEGVRVQGTWHDAAAGGEYAGQWCNMQPHGQGVYYVPGLLRYAGKLGLPLAKPGLQCAVLAGVSSSLPCNSALPEEEA